jgi:hypothetical protein
MNRFGLVSWYVFFQYCLNGMIQEKSKTKQEVDALNKDENAKLISLCKSLHESQSKRHSIDEIQAFKSSVDSNILVPQKICDVLFHIGFPSTKVSSNVFFSLSTVPPIPHRLLWTMSLTTTAGVAKLNGCQHNHCQGHQSQVTFCQRGFQFGILTG